MARNIEDKFLYLRNIAYQLYVAHVSFHNYNYN